MTNLAGDSGDLTTPDDEDLEVLPDDDEPVADLPGLDEERSIDDTQFDLDGELPLDDI